MRPFGFSTGALARGDFARALRMLDGFDLEAVELSALRSHELPDLTEFVEKTDLSRFSHISVHAPTDYEADEEASIVKRLAVFARKGWPIVPHPDVIRDYTPWKQFGPLLLIENMDKRKPVGRTVEELERIFERLPEAGMCFDIAHARQVDSSMTEAYRIVRTYRDAIKQVHISVVNTSSRHDLISPSVADSFRTVAILIPGTVPAILETPVKEGQLEGQLEMAAFSMGGRVTTQVV